MKQVVIENPILNSPFKEPRRHFKLMDEIVEARHVSQYFIPIPRPKTGKIAVKVVDHYGNEVLKVYEV